MGNMRDPIIRATDFGFDVSGKVGLAKRVIRCVIPEEDYAQVGYSAEFHDQPDWKGVRELIAANLTNALLSLQADDLWSADGDFLG